MRPSVDGSTGKIAQRARYHRNDTSQVPAPGRATASGTNSNPGASARRLRLLLVATLLHGEKTWERKELNSRGLMVHDLRQAAARNLWRAAAAGVVIMKIGGWRTRSVFERYAIVSQSDISDAIQKLESPQNGHSFGNSGEAETPEPESQSFQKTFGEGSLISGAGRGSRTPKTRRSADFESAASASSAIPASERYQQVSTGSLTTETD